MTLPGRVLSDWHPGEEVEKDPSTCVERVVPENNYWHFLLKWYMSCYDSPKESLFWKINSVALTLQLWQSQVCKCLILQEEKSLILWERKSDPDSPKKFCCSSIAKARGTTRAACVISIVVHALYEVSQCKSTFKYQFKNKYRNLKVNCITYKYPNPKTPFPQPRRGFGPTLLLGCTSLSHCKCSNISAE